MSGFRWNSERYDQLEHPCRNGLRVVVQRRGTEYIVLADRVATGPRGEAFHARLPMTGETMEAIDEEIKAWVDIVYERADASPSPALDQVYSDVYSDMEPEKGH